MASHFLGECVIVHAIATNDDLVSRWLAIWHGK
jgi:hypothetical protein